MDLSSLDALESRLKYLEDLLHTPTESGSDAEVKNSRSFSLVSQSLFNNYLTET